MKETRKIDWHACMRTAGCIVLLLAAYLLQTGLGVRLSVFHTHIDVLPLIVAAAAVFMGPHVGMICGLAAGILYDASGVHIEGLYPLYYMLGGIACGECSLRFCAHKWLCTVGGAAGMLVVLTLLRYVFSFQPEQAGILCVVQALAVQLVFLLLLSVPVAGLVRKLCAKPSEQTEDPEI